MVEFEQDQRHLYDPKKGRNQGKPPEPEAGTLGFGTGAGKIKVDLGDKEEDQELDEQDISPEAPEQDPPQQDRGTGAGYTAGDAFMDSLGSGRGIVSSAAVAGLFAKYDKANEQQGPGEYGKGDAFMESLESGRGIVKSMAVAGVYNRFQNKGQDGPEQEGDGQEMGGSGMGKGDAFMESISSGRGMLSSIAVAGLFDRYQNQSGVDGPEQGEGMGKGDAFMESLASGRGIITSMVVAGLFNRFQTKGQDGPPIPDDLVLVEEFSVSSAPIREAELHEVSDQQPSISDQLDKVEATMDAEREAGVEVNPEMVQGVRNSVYAERAREMGADISEAIDVGRAHDEMVASADQQLEAGDISQEQHDQQMDNIRASRDMAFSSPEQLHANSEALNAEQAPELDGQEQDAPEIGSAQQQAMLESEEYRQKQGIDPEGPQAEAAGPEAEADAIEPIGDAGLEAEDKEVSSIAVESEGFDVEASPVAQEAEAEGPAAGQGFDIDEGMIVGDGGPNNGQHDDLGLSEEHRAELNQALEGLAGLGGQEPSGRDGGEMDQQSVDTQFNDIVSNLGDVAQAAEESAGMSAEGARASQQPEMASQDASVSR